jgi:hypothetical protein
VLPEVHKLGASDEVGQPAAGVAERPPVAAVDR